MSIVRDHPLACRRRRPDRRGGVLRSAPGAATPGGASAAPAHADARRRSASAAAGTAVLAGGRRDRPADVGRVRDRDDGARRHLAHRRQIVSATTTNIQPDQGHVHLYVDNVLVSMNYGLEQDLPVSPGTYVLKAEFVAVRSRAVRSPGVVAGSLLHRQVSRRAAVLTLAAGLGVIAVAQLASPLGSPPLYDGVVPRSRTATSSRGRTRPARRRRITGPCPSPGRRARRSSRPRPRARRRHS